MVCGGLKYEHKTTTGTFGITTDAETPRADHPAEPEGEGWSLVSTVATINGFLIWTWQRSTPIASTEEAVAEVVRAAGLDVGTTNVLITRVISAMRRDVRAPVPSLCPPVDVAPILSGEMAVTTGEEHLTREEARGQLVAMGYTDRSADLMLDRAEDRRSFGDGEESHVLRAYVKGFKS